MDKFKPINENRPPQTPAEEHFAYLNSPEGEEEFKNTFTAEGMLNSFKSKAEEIEKQKKKDLQTSIEKFKTTEIEVKSTIDLLKDLKNAKIISDTTAYLTILKSLREIAYGQNNSSIKFQLLKNKAIIADTIITELRQNNFITNETSLNIISSLLTEYLTQIQNRISFLLKNNPEQDK